MGRGVQHRGRPAVHAERARRRSVARRWASTPSIEHLPARHEVAHAHSSHEQDQAVFGARHDAARGRAARDGGLGAASTAPASTPSFDGIEIDAQPAGGVAAAMSAGVGDYHDVHLPEDPARAVVWRVDRRPLVAAGFRTEPRARNRRRVLLLDQRRPRRAPRRGRQLARLRVARGQRRRDDGARPVRRAGSARRRIASTSCSHRT